MKHEIIEKKRNSRKVVKQKRRVNMSKKVTACFCIFCVVLGLTGCNSDGNSVQTNKEVTPG